MKLPHWVEQDIEQLPVDFTGQILIECWQGGVTRRDFVDRRQSPKPEKEQTARFHLNKNDVDFINTVGQGAKVITRRIF